MPPTPLPPTPTTHSPPISPSPQSPPNPLSTAPSLPQLLLPFVPILAVALLFLFLLRLLLRQFRQCLSMRLQMVCGDQSTSTSGLSQRVTHTTAQSSVGTIRHNSMGDLHTNDSNGNGANEITPWTGREPCSPPPLFLLHSDMFFPAAGAAPGGGRFLDPSAAAFWLDHQQLVQMLGPMPPKYEDAIKMIHHSPMASPSRNIQPLCISSLESANQSRRLSQSGAASPPPCYEQAMASQIVVPSNGQVDEVALDNFEGSNQRMEATRRTAERPPSYARTTMPNSANLLDRMAAENCASSLNLNPQTAIRSASLPPPLLDEDQRRPCSSCSLREIGGEDSLFAASSRSQQSAQQMQIMVEQRKRALGTFVPKHAGGSARIQRGDGQKEGELAETSG